MRVGGGGGAGLGVFFIWSKFRERGLIWEGVLFNLAKCVARGKTEEETYKSYGTLPPVLEWEARKEATTTNSLKMVWILHKDRERKVENLRYMKLEVMQLKIKNKYEIPACE